MPLLSIVIPTVPGREHWVKRAEAAFERTLPDDLDWEWLVIRDMPTCGLAWRAGQKAYEGDYLMLSADDIEPQEGWLEAAIEVVEDGKLPSPLILNTDGSVQSFGDAWMPGQLPEDGTKVDITRVPFASREQWDRLGPSIPTHYFTDNWVTHRGNDCGIDTVLCRGYVLTHHFAPEGRVDWRMGSDRQAFQKYKAGALKP